MAAAGAAQAGALAALLSHAAGRGGAAALLQQRDVHGSGALHYAARAGARGWMGAPQTDADCRREPAPTLHSAAAFVCALPPKPARPDS
jgi:hypothetical protein